MVCPYVFSQRAAYVWSGHDLTENRKSSVPQSSKGGEQPDTEI